MSMIAIASRILFTRLVRGQTLVGANVQNSPTDPLGDVLRENRMLITVYTSTMKRKITGRDLRGGAQGATMELVFQVYIPNGEQQPEDEDDSPLSMTGAGAAFLIERIQFEILRALQGQHNVWSELWAKLIVGYDDYDCRPILLQQDEGGPRIPCRETSLVCRHGGEPEFAKPLSGLWLELHDALVADNAEGVALAQQIKDTIESPVGLPDWRLLMANNAFSLNALRNIGLAPVDITAEDDGALLGQDEGSLDPSEIAIVAPPETNLPPSEDE